MLNKQEVRRLQIMKGTAMISIIAPVDHGFSAGEKNAATLKHLIKTTKENLAKNYDPARVKKLVEKLNTLEKEIDYQESTKGFAMFISDDYAKIIDLPFVPGEKAMVGRSFETRDLLLALENSVEYLLLSLSMGTVHLYRGKGEELMEIKDKFFPLEHKPIERSGPVDGFEHVGSEELEDMKIFIRKTAEHLLHFVQTDKTALFVAGEDKYRSFFKEHTAAGKHMKGELPYSLHNMHTKQMVDKALPEIEGYFENEKQLLISKFEEAKGSELATKGLKKVWRAVKLGQVQTLLVEENYKQSGRTKTSDELELLFEDDAMGLMATWHDDIVDDVIEMVSQMDGKIVFYKDGQLTKQEKIGAILRYAV
jgi:hypothetical protein